MESSIDRLFSKNPENYDHKDMELFQEFKDALNAGKVRAAEPDPGTPTGWKVNAWVKRGILVGFRMGKSVDMTAPGSRFPYIDKSTYPPRKVS